jgi:hypothetical protein
MSRIYRDGVHEVTMTAGTGDIVLGGPFTQRLAFRDVCVDGDTFYYRVQPRAGQEWEEGIGTYKALTNAIERTTILKSSNANTVVPFPEGFKSVFLHENTARVVHHKNTLTNGNFTQVDADGDLVNATPINVTGSRAGNAALANLCAALATHGIIINSTTA